MEYIIHSEKLHIPDISRDLLDNDYMVDIPIIDAMTNFDLACVKAYQSKLNSEKSNHPLHSYIHQSKIYLSCSTSQGLLEAKAKGIYGEARTISKEKYYEYAEMVDADFVEWMHDDAAREVIHGGSDLEKPSKRYGKAVDRSILWGKNVNKGGVPVLVGGVFPLLKEKMLEALEKEGPFDMVRLGNCFRFYEGEDKWERLRDCVSDVKDRLGCKEVILRDMDDPFSLLLAAKAGITKMLGKYPFTVAVSKCALTFPIQQCDERMEFMINLSTQKYEDDFQPISKDCTCRTCKNYSRAYINHLINAHEMTGSVLLKIHNLHYYRSFCQEITQKQKDGALDEYSTWFFNVNAV